MNMKLVFKDMEGLREYAPRVTVSRFEIVRDFIEQATLRYVQPAMCGAYDELAGYLSGDELGNAALNALAPYVRRVVAYYALFGFIRAGGAQITAQGVQRAETDTHKASSYGDKMDTLNYYAEEADAALDALLHFLDAHAGDYPSYAPPTPELLITSAAVYTHYVNIGGSRRTYLALQPELRNAEMFKLQPVLGDALLAQLRQYACGRNDALAATPLEHVADKALDYARAAAAHTAIHRALPTLTLRCSDGAIGVASFYSPSAQERAALAQVLTELRAQAEVTASTYTALLTKLLLAPEDGDVHEIANSAENKHYVTFF
jgi:hypothetical protein